ncbi:DUF488 domain-containing protein [Desulfobacterota bacterium AH_259_B03_O07]|nr:DUF488 domain-containing protein [Desulfobacterota bacterium AH_259_B03_O07]
MDIKVKRVFEKASKDDGIRILVDRLWPRGMSKKDALLDLWLKDVAPSNELRKWFNHEPEKWEEFKSRYFSELDKKLDLVSKLKKYAGGGTLTLLFSAKETKFNNAIVLKEYLEKEL